LTVYEAYSGFFRDKETSLLAQTASDISFAVSRLYELEERRRAEHALSVSEDKYRALIETTGTGYVFLDLQGNVRDANEQYVRLTGHTSFDEIVGRSVLEWTASYDRQRNLEAIETCRRRGYIRDLEIDYADAAGRITPVEISATLASSGEVPVIISLCRDISDRKQAEAGA
jgi:PAS domain S-box-containing protein